MMCSKILTAGFRLTLSSHQPRHWLTLMLLVGLALALALVSSRQSGLALAPAQAAAADTDALAEAGLIKFSSNYITAAEKEFLDIAKDLPSAQTKLRKTSKDKRKLDESIAKKNDEITRLRAELTKIKSQMASLGPIPNATIYNQLVQQNNLIVARLQQLETEIDPTKNEYLKKTRQEYSEALSELVKKVLQLKELETKIRQEYEKLRQDEKIMTAITAASQERKVELGPSNAFEAKIRSLNAAEKLIQVDYIQLEPKGNVWGLDVTINNMRPFPILLDTGASFISLPYKIAQDLGLDLSDSSTVPVQLRIANGMVITGKKVVLDSVRVGPFEVKKVDAVVLPADASEAEALLGGSFLNNFEYKLDAQTGKLTLSRSAEDDKED